MNRFALATCIVLGWAAMLSFMYFPLLSTYRMH